MVDSPSDRPTERPPLAIVGISALFPGSTEVGGFWRDIMAGRDLIGEVPPHYWLVEDFYDPDPRAEDKTYCKRGAFLSQVGFDPIEFGIPPANIKSTDTCQLLALMVAKQVLEDASQGQFATMDRERISVILGVAAGLELVGEMAGRLQRPIWVKALREHGLDEDQVQAICKRISSHSVPWTEATFPGLLGNVVTGRIANRFDLGGTNCTTDAACASSFSALTMAANELYLGDSDLVITGGVDTTNDPFLFLCFSKTPALSFSNDCRPFSDAADGTMLGEGLGMVALKRLADAERDGDRVYAVIKGIGTASDGRAKSVYAPRPEGQARALRRAYAAAGYSPRTVELVEAHGTGTMAGDIAEFEGLCDVFGSENVERQWCALGSIKSQLGHTKAAAGVAGLIKVALALHHKVLPPTIKVERPDPKLEVARSPFYLNTQTRPWIRAGGHPRRASVSSFGFGGTNFHVTLEEHTGRAPHAFKRWPVEDQLVLLAGSSPQALAAVGERWAAELSEPGMLRFLARTSQQGFDAGQPARLAVVAASEEDLRRKLKQAITAILERPDTTLSLPNGIFYGLAGEPGKIAFLFSGQGSQYVGMGADLAMTFDEARRIWDELAAPLHEVVFPIPVFSDEERRAHEERLRATEQAQPAIGAVSLSILALLRSLGLEPDCTGGHSFGEVTALCAAGVLTEQDLLKVARRRGQLMAEAAETPGSMIAVVHPLEELRALLDGWQSDVVIANINGPKQVVLSGTTEAIEALEPRLGEQGIQARRLPVATAFHSPVVERASVPFAELLEQIPIGRARVPVYANSEAAPYPDDAAAVRRLLAHQIARPVRFAEEVEAMWEAGVRTFVEVGPGSVLTNLVGGILEGRPHLAVSTDRKGLPGVRALLGALGQLSVAGVALELDPLWRAYAPVTDPRAIEKPKLTLPIDGVNHGKIYPPEGGVEALPKPNRTATSDGGKAARAASPAGAAAEAVPAGSPGTASPHEHLQDGHTMSSPPPPPPQAPKPPDPQPVPPAGGGPAAQLSWLQTFQELQRQTAEAHATYQRVMAESHMAFLRTAEVTSQHLHAVITGQPLSEQAPPARETLAAPSPSAIPQAPQIMPPAPPSPVAVTPYAGQPEVPAPAPPPAPEPSPTPSEGVDGGGGDGVGTAGAIEAIDFRELLLSVVAEKTGYPEEILTMEMGLEADLGIDSIKRVEILSALQERAPGLPEVDASQIPNLQTLGQVLEFLERFEADGGGGNGNGGRAVVSEALPGSVSVSEPEVEVEVRRSAVRETGAPASGTSIMEGLTPDAVVKIIDDGNGVAGALAERLSRRGLRAEVVTQEAGTDGAGAVLYLGGLRELSDEDTAIDLNREAFRLARQVARRFTDEGGVLVTVQDTGGDFGLSGGAGPRAFAAGLASLAKTASLEWDKARVKAIDLERGDRTPEAQAEALERELFDGGPEQEVGLHSDGTRTTLTAEPASIAAGGDGRAISADDGSVLVVSGGGRGVTAAALVELARRFRPRFVLLGRTGLEEEPEICVNAPDDAGLKRVLLEQAKAEGRTIVPAELGRQVQRILANREIRATLSALQAAGSECRYLAVDVTDAAAVGAALERIRAEWGPVTGVIHGAGVLSDKRIADKTSEQFDRVFDTKVEGLRSLLRATAADPLRLICIYSSVAARFGNVGQCDYAMANEVLNRVAAAEAKRRGASCVVRSIDWGPWEGGMVTPSLKAHFKAMGVSLIPIEAGTRMLVEELQVGDGPVEVIIGSPPQGMVRPSSRGAQRPADSLAVVS